MRCTATYLHSSESHHCLLYHFSFLGTGGPSFNLLLLWDLYALITSSRWNTHLCWNLDAVYPDYNETEPMKRRQYLPSFEFQSPPFLGRRNMYEEAKELKIIQLLRIGLKITRETKKRINEARSD